MSKLSQYQSFVAVVEEGNITKAASNLNLSTPAISKQLVQLETTLKVQLFHRSHKRLDITESGKRFYTRCKSILSSINLAEEELLSEQEALNGTISVTLSKALCRSKLIEIIAAFSDIHQGIEFNIHFSDQIEDLYDKSIDFAFRLGDLNDSTTMMAIPLIETQLIACATRKYLHRHGIPKSFSKLGGCQFILTSHLNPIGQLKAFLNKERFDFANSVAHTSNDIEGIYQLVNANLGIGLMLDISIQKELDEGNLVSVLRWWSLRPTRSCSRCSLPWT